MTDWITGSMTHSMEPGEMLAGIDLPIWPQGHGYAFEEFARRHGDFAIAAVGCLVDLAADGTIARAALCVSGLGPAPVRLAKAERLLVGERPSHEAFRAAAVEAEALEASSDSAVARGSERRAA
jgi:carbon-monoxide dehydrogenase medium subunit